MNCLGGNVCHIEAEGFTFGAAANHLKTANRAIITRDCQIIKIKLDNRGPVPVRNRNKCGGFVVGGRNDAKSTGRVGCYYRFTVNNGCIYIDLTQEVQR